MISSLLNLGKALNIKKKGVMEMYFYYLSTIIILSVIVVLLNKIFPLIIKLQVIGCKANTFSSKNIGKNKSTFPLSLMKGSITLEATVVLPIFITFILSIYSFFYIYNYQNIVQMSVYNTAKSIGRYSYIMERAEDMGKEYIDSIQKLNVDKEILTSGVNMVYVWNKVMNDEVKKYTVSSNIMGGKNGISVLDSDIDTETGENDIVVSYKMGIDIPDIKKIRYKLINRCYFRAWVGESIVDIQDKIKQKTVYITPHGKVYHIYFDCSHIELSISAIPFKSVNDLRNKNGGKYYRCDRCVKKTNEDDIVYITDTGTSYHINSKCSGIKRDILEIEISNVGNRKLCSRCKEKYEKESN